jgi:protein-disulfide isomerase
MSRHLESDPERILMKIYLSIALMLVTLAGAQQKPVTSQPAAKPVTASGLPSQETVNAFMQKMFGYDPSVTWEVVSIKPSSIAGISEVNVILKNPQGQQNTKLYVAADGHSALIGEIIPFGPDPFAAARTALEKGINGPSRGPADAPVTIVEFSDLQCPHCKEAQPTVDKLMSEEKNARLVFQNFPLQSHDWAAKAAAYADCIGRNSNDAFWKFMQGVYDAQSDILTTNADEKLTALADKSGVKGSDIAACAAKPETASRLEHSVALGKSLDVNGTPTLFISGRKIANVAGLPYDMLKQLVEFAAKK